MKTKLFFFAMLISVAASATVKVTPISADYAAQKVTFKVEWTNSPTAPYNNRVWVWIDFCPVNGVTPGGFAPATITGATITSGSGSTSTLTGRGFFIAGSATNTGTTVTATLNPVPAGKFNWCVYGSDYPPNVTLENGTYTFKGTINFIVSSHAQPITTKTIAKANLTVTTASTFTDATGCPGIGSLYCPYTGSDLYMDANHLCLQRASGAKNWEAWIKDTRDNELYRIVLMPDTKWWLAQNVKLSSYNGTTTGVAISGCTKDDCGRGYTYAQAYASYGGTSGWNANVQGVCPPSWLLPITQDWQTFTNAISSSATVITQRLRALDSPCSPVTDYYGWAQKIGVAEGKAINANWSNWYRNSDSCPHHGLSIDGHIPNQNNGTCNYYSIGYATSCGSASVSVRCFRQL